MASNVLDSVLFRDSFGTPAMRAVFDDRELVRKYVEVEVALAKAQARCGVIPEAAAQEIAEKCNADTLDFDLLRHETEIVGYPILPLVHQISKQAGESGGYVHWGATTQDIMDTAVVLQIRDAFALIESDMDKLRATLADLSRRYRDTPMAGRTHLQQALPVTFGYKTAIWLDMFERHAERLTQARPRVLVGEFAGAAGTLASLGDKGLAVQKAMMEELGLNIPTSTWHVARDGFAEAVNLLAVITGSLGKIAYDVMLLAAYEFGELYEPFVKGRGASSTMPQKRNPISSELMLACAKGVRQQAGLMLDAMVQDLERATGPWHAEWIAIPESFVLSAGALHQANFMLAGLVVDEAAMKRNLGMTNGLIVAEAVMMGLAPYIGRQDAHDVVYDACRIVNEQGGRLADVLNAMPSVSERLDPQLIEELTDPANYLGMAPAMVDQVLARYMSRK
ncbi:class-II fumarase/aspartase family protein [Citrobacter freundii]